MDPYCHSVQSPQMIANLGHLLLCLLHVLSHSIVLAEECRLILKCSKFFRSGDCPSPKSTSGLPLSPNQLLGAPLNPPLGGAPPLNPPLGAAPPLNPPLVCMVRDHIRHKPTIHHYHLLFDSTILPNSAYYPRMHTILFSYNAFHRQ